MLFEPANWTRIFRRPWPPSKPGLASDAEDPCGIPHGSRHNAYRIPISPSPDKLRRYLNAPFYNIKMGLVPWARSKDRSRDSMPSQNALQCLGLERKRSIPFRRMRRWKHQLSWGLFG